jgi:hypothetical protein
VEITNTKLSLEFEMDRLQLLNRLEPDLIREDGECLALLSIAVSLKIIADNTNRQSLLQKVEAAHTQMVNALGKRRNRLSLSEAIDSATNYFHKLTGIRYVP